MRPRLVRAALSVLPRRERAVLELVYWRERSIPEAAATLGVCRSTAWRRYRAALKRLRGVDMRPLSHSSMALGRFCLRAYWYRYEAGLVPVEESDALAWGSAWHAALAALRDYRSLDAALDAAAPEGCDPRMAIAAGALITAYVRRYPLEEEPVFVAVEREFSFSLPGHRRRGRQYAFVGVIDALDEDHRVWESKSTGMRLDESSPYWALLDADPQISLYLAAAETLNVSNASTCVYDVTRRPDWKERMVADLDEDGLKVVVDQEGQRVKTKTGTWRQTPSAADGYTVRERPETDEEMVVRILTDCAESPGAWFQRRPVLHFENRINDYLNECAQLADALADAADADAWYRNVSRLTCSHCDYYPLCMGATEYTPGTAPEGYRLRSQGDTHESE